jgi:hypothetical protein
MKGNGSASSLLLVRTRLKFLQGIRFRDKWKERNNIDDPANLPADQIVTAQQLTMRSGQKVSDDKAKEFGRVAANAETVGG